MVASREYRDCSGVIENDRKKLEVQKAGGRSISSCSDGKFSTQQIIRLNSYFALVDEIVDMGVPIKQVYRNLPKSASSNTRYGLVTISALKLQSPIRKRMVDYIFNQCADDKLVDIQELARVSGVDAKEWTEEDFREHYQKDKAEQAIRGRSGGLKLIQRLRDLVSKTVLEGDTSVLNERNESIVGKLRILRALSEPLFNHCEKMNAAGYGDNPYAALAHLVKFWNEGHPIKEEGSDGK